MSMLDAFEKHRAAKVSESYYAWSNNPDTSVPVVPQHFQSLYSDKKREAHVFIGEAALGAAMAATHNGVAVSIGLLRPTEVPCIVFTPEEALAVAAMLVKAAGEAAATNAKLNAKISFE